MSSQIRKARVAILTRVSVFLIVILGLCLSILLLPSRVSTQATETCVQPPSGIIAWWPLDETSGTAAEEIVGGFDGVHVNGPMPSPGRVGGALRFDGSSYLGVPDSDLWVFGTNDFTIELWANWDSPGSGDLVHAGDVLIGNDEGPGLQNKWFFALGGGFLHFTVYNELDPPSNFFLVRAPFSPTVGQWYHLGVTKRGTLFTIYVDGIPVGSEVSISPIANPDAPLIIGQSNEPFGGFMNGLLDEVTIYNRALRQGELQAIFDAGSAGKCKALSIATKSLSAIRLGDIFSQRLETRFGQPPFTWSIVAGTLPAGVSLSSEGLLSGTPAEAGTFTFTVRVADSNAQSADKTIALDVVLTLPPPDIQVNLTGTTPVPGRELDVFAVLENTGTVNTAHIPVELVLGPWHTFVEAQPSPDEVAEIELPVPISNAPKSSISLLRWDIRALNSGQMAVLSFKALLASQYPLGEEHSLNLCMDIRNSNCQKFLDRECFRPCAEKARTDCLLPNGFEVYSPCYNPAIALCLTTCTKCKETNEAIGATPFLIDQPTSPTCADWNSRTRGPLDPNEKSVAARRFIQPDQLLVYPVHFENIGDIEARDVFVTDQFDPNLDSSTLNLLTPAGGSFDVTTKTIRWALLNRNLEPGETGNVLLSVRPRPGLPSGTIIRNSATIQFEVFQPIVTNEVINIIDSTRPAAVVNPLPPETSTPNFPISWNGSDAIGEIDFYSIFVSVDGGAFTPFLETTRDTSATFTGEVGKTYGFLAIATDTAGNIEVQPAIAEASTRVVTTCSTGDIEPPTITAPPAITLHTGLDTTSCGVTINDLNATLGVASVSDNCPDITVTRSGVPAGSVFPVGDTTITYTAMDASGNVATATQLVTVIDNTVPTIIGESASPQALWPPDHAMREVTLNYVVSDNCGSVNCVITNISSNEPVNGTGDGDTAADWEVVDAHHVRLRAERAASGNGRTYTITITCVDSAGNSTSRNVNLFVPHDIRNSNTGLSLVGSAIIFLTKFFLRIL